MRRLMFLLCALALTIGFGATAAMAQTSTCPSPYTVSSGENLFRISLRCGVTMQAIQAANPAITNTNLIYAGQQLVIPSGGAPTTTGGTTGGTTTGGTTGGTTTGGTTGGGTATTYTVQTGDTLSRIAARFGTTVQAIVTANGITNPNLIFPGTVLNISGSTPPPTTGGGTTTGGTTGGTTTGTTTGGVPISGGFELGGQVFGFQYPDQMRGAGMTWAKIQVVWTRGEGTGAAQNAINAARGNGFRVLLSITGNPAELAGNPTQYYQDFANYLGQVAALGPDGIEIWNEANIDRQWPAGQISGSNYAQMLIAGYAAIKNVNANVLVVSGAPSPTGFFGGTCQTNGCDDDIFLRQLRDAGGANSMDCVGIHYNEGIVAPTARSGDPRGNSGHYTRYYGTMVDLYSSVFPNKPLCFTELGYLTPEGLGPLPSGFAWAANVTLQNQAEWLASAVSLARTSRRVRLLIVWNVDSTSYGADPQQGYAIVRGNECRACQTVGAVMRQ